MPRYFCPVCGRETAYFHVTRAAQVAQVTRATVYNWLKRRQVHMMVCPSGRKFICSDSLVRPAVMGGSVAASVIQPGIV